MINPNVLLAKWYSTKLLNNSEQTDTEKVGVPLVVHKVSYKTTIYDRATRTVRNEEQLVVETRVKSSVDFQINDILEIKSEKWVIDSIENPDPFAVLQRTVRLTLKR